MPLGKLFQARSQEADLPPGQMRRRGKKLRRDQALRDKGTALEPSKNQRSILETAWGAKTATKPEVPAPVPGPVPYTAIRG